jgi:hypothetical protein
MMAGELVERWWNGRFGRLARRDVWLYRSTTWRVESREGDADSGRGNTWTYDDEDQARAMVRRLLDTGGAPPIRRIGQSTQARSTAVGLKPRRRLILGILILRL